MAWGTLFDALWLPYGLGMVFKKRHRPKGESDPELLLLSRMSPLPVTLNERRICRVATADISV